jgi:hypothetical protein
MRDVMTGDIESHAMSGAMQIVEGDWTTAESSIWLSYIPLVA